MYIMQYDVVIFNCCLELEIEILKYTFGFQGQAIDFSM